MTSPLAASSDRRRRLLGWCLVPFATLVFAACGSDDGDGAIPQSGERETTTTESTTTTTAADAADAEGEADATETGATGAEPADAPTGEWTIESLATGTETTAAPPDASLTFADGTVNVATGCNTGSGSAEVADGSIVLGAVGLTMMACPEDVMAFEAELVGFLEGELTYETSDAGLVLARDDMELALTSAG